MLDDLQISEQEKTHFKALLRDDPQANLEERYAFFEDYNPDYCRQRFGFVPQLFAQDWMVIGLEAEGFSYTAGLYYRYDHPEILLESGPRDMLERMHILNTIGVLVRDGGRLELGRELAPVIFADSLFQVNSLIFRAYSEADFQRTPCGYLFSFYQFFKDELFEDGNDIPVVVAELDNPADLASIDARLEQFVSAKLQLKDV